MKKPIIFICFLLLTVNCFGAPDEISQKLLSDSPSMMDWGLRCTERQIESTLNLGFNKMWVLKGTLDKVQYDFSKDQIVFSVQIWPKDAEAKAYIKKNISKEAFPGIYKTVITSMNNMLSARGFNYLDLCFSHNGFVNSEFELSEQEFKEFFKKIIIKYKFALDLKPIAVYEANNLLFHEPEFENFWKLFIENAELK